VRRGKLLRWCRVNNSIYNLCVLGAFARVKPGNLSPGRKARKVFWGKNTKNLRAPCASARNRTQAIPKAFMTLAEAQGAQREAVARFAATKHKFILCVPGEKNRFDQSKITVRLPHTSRLCFSWCHIARASTTFSRSRPFLTMSSTVSLWLTCTTSCSMIGPASSSAVT
jgi:hypothetical protein